MVKYVFYILVLLLAAMPVLAQEYDIRNYQQAYVYSGMPDFVPQGQAKAQGITALSPYWVHVGNYFGQCTYQGYDSIDCTNAGKSVYRRNTHHMIANFGYTPCGSQCIHS